MLVRLTSSTSGEMVMLAEHAHVLWEWMDKEGSAHGVFMTGQLPAAIDRLRRGIEQDKLDTRRRAEEARMAEAARAAEAAACQEEEPGMEKKEEAPEEPVSLAQRAQPLLRLMELTCREDGFVTWEAPADF